jgi:pimeloyl-ACP methyl ester carboxylesterase
MPVVSAGSVQIDYERSGTGPPLLLIMGMAGSRLTWGDPFLERLRPDFDTIVYNHRGIGASSRVEQPFTIGELADDAAGLLDSLELESVHVIGISMGGMVAQELALAHPERLRSLVLGCTYSGGPGSSRTSEAVWQGMADAMASGDRERAVRTAWEANVSARFAQDADAYARFGANARRMPVAVAVIMAQAQAILGHDTSARLAQLRPPTLVVHGTEDQMVPVSNAHMVAGLIPGSRLEILEGVGHLFFWEQPEHSAALVRDHAAATVS